MTARCATSATECISCGRLCNGTRGLATHLRQVHNEMKPDSRESPIDFDVITKPPRGSRRIFARDVRAGDSIWAISSPPMRVVNVHKSDEAVRVYWMPRGWRRSFEFTVPASCVFVRLPPEGQ